MSRYLCSVLLLSAMANMPLTAQRTLQQKHTPKEPQAHLDVAITYDSTRTNAVTGSNFWMHGGAIQMHGKFWRGLGTVAHISGTHTGNIHSTGLGMELVTATFGPRYTWSPAHGRLSLFGQILVGQAIGFNGVFPESSGASDSANSFALREGAGMDVVLSRHLAIRVLDVNWLRTSLSNGGSNVQNSLQFGTGFVFRIGKH